MNQLCIRDLAETVGGRLRLGCLPPLGGELEPLGRVALDSRLVSPGEVFWGLAGINDDGSRHAEEAFARGASGAVVAGRRLEPWAGKFSLEVDDTKAALWRLARAMRRRFTGKLIGVAGSGGQTAARKTIRTVLGGRAEPAGESRRYENEAGLAQRLLELDEHERFEVVEMQAGAPGEVDRVAHLCCPHIGVLVGCGDSSGGFGTPTLLAQSQAELLAALPDQGWAVCNGDDPGLRRAVGQTAAQVVWFGSGPHCDIYASEVQWRGGGLSLVVDGQPVRLAACGRDHLSAVLAAYAVGRILETAPRRIAAALARFRPEARQTRHEPTREYALTT